MKANKFIVSPQMMARNGSDQYMKFYSLGHAKEDSCHNEYMQNSLS